MFLRLKGFRILSRRYRTPLGEIDIIARKRSLILMVEVKARHSICEAVDSVTYESMRRIQNASDIWLSRQPDAHALNIRFDIIAMCPGKLPVHLENAF